MTQYYLEMSDLGTFLMFEITDVIFVPNMCKKKENDVLPVNF